MRTHWPNIAVCSGRRSDVTAESRSTPKATPSSSRSARRTARSRQPETVIEPWDPDPSGSVSGSTPAPPFERPRDTWATTSTEPPGSRPPGAADRSWCRCRRCNRSRQIGSPWWISATIGSRTCRRPSASTSWARETSHRSGPSTAPTCPCRRHPSSAATTRSRRSPRRFAKRMSRSSPSPVPGVRGRRVSRSRPPPKPPSRSRTEPGGYRSRRFRTMTSSLPGSHSRWKWPKRRRRLSSTPWRDGSAADATSSCWTTPSISSRRSRRISPSSCRRRRVRRCS